MSNHDNKGNAKQSTSLVAGIKCQIAEAIDWAQNTIITGGGGFEPPDVSAKTYLKDAKGDVGDAIDSVIAWHVAYAATAGFTTNIGGAITLPAAIPANILSTIFIQMRMIAIIAAIRGLDLRSDKVRITMIACLCGKGAVDILKEVGVNVSTKVAKNAVMSVSGATIRKINEMVAFRLVTKAGETGAINLIKIVPFVAGGVCAIVDGACTRAIGKAAKRTLARIDNDPPLIEAQAVPVDNNPPPTKSRPIPA